jgi:hypothetical protein
MAKRVEVDIKTRGADKASKDLGKVDKGLGKLAKSAAGAAASFFGARMLLDGFRSMINATREQILAETQLNAVLKSTAGVAGLTAKELTNMASALQKQTRFGDEAIIKAQSLMLTFTKVGKEVFPDAIEAVLNMSEAMGQDLQQGVIQVGKALNDPILGVTALRRVGVQLTKQQEEQVKAFTKSGQIARAQKIILSELETQFGGVAKAAGETMPGALDQMNNAIGDAQESIGEVLSPVVVTISDDIENLANIIGEAAKELSPFINAVNTKIEKDGFFGTLFGGMRDLGFGLNTLLDIADHVEQTQQKLAAPDRPKASLIPDEDDMAEDLVVVDDFYNYLQEQESNFTEFQRKQAKTQKIIDDQLYKEKIQNNLQSAILQGQTAKQAGVSVIKAEVAEAQAGLISSIMKSLPFPINLAVAAGAGGMIGKVTDSLFSSFATGGSFVTKGRTTLPIGNGVVVGDNASGMERVDVTPLPSPTSNGNNITINISAPLVDETVVDHIIPAIRRAEKLNL